MSSYTKSVLDKEHALLPIPRRNPNLSAHCILLSEPPRRGTQSNVLPEETEQNQL